MEVHNNVKMPYLVSVGQGIPVNDLRNVFGSVSTRTHKKSKETKSMVHAINSNLFRNPHDCTTREKILPVEIDSAVKHLQSTSFVPSGSANDTFTLTFSKEESYLRYRSAYPELLLTMSRQKEFAAMPSNNSTSRNLELVLAGKKIVPEWSDLRSRREKKKKSKLTARIKMQHPRRRACLILMEALFRFRALTNPTSHLVYD